MGNDVRRHTRKEDNFLQSRTDSIQPSRHIFVSNARGVITELEKLQTDEYIIRYHKSSAQAGFLLDAGSWIGFCYCDKQWSFVKQ
jgi:hypothetical protein